MRHIRWIIVVTGILLTSLLSHADDRDKAEKQLRHITAMASDPTGRRVVSITMSDFLKVKRVDLIKQRRMLNLNYGGLFLAYKVMATGTTLEELAAEIHRGSTMAEIAGKQGNWKQILDEVKKLNGKIDRHLYEHFVDAREDHQRDQDDRYNLMSDITKADNDVGDEDLASAGDVYDRAHDLAMQRAGRHPDESPDAVDDLQFRRDHARDSAPKPSDVGISKPPR